MAARLTDLERRERALSERDFMRQVTDLAVAFGWTWCHWRALRNGRGIWQVPVEGPLGKGWPDLTMLRVRDGHGRLLFVELKRELEQPSSDQHDVLGQLSALGALWIRPIGEAANYRNASLHVDVAVWRPSDLRDPIGESVIGRILR